MRFPIDLNGPLERSSAGKHIKGFDGLRGLAAFAVVLHHTLTSVHTHLGEVAVYMFFSLSGFLIFNILESSRRSVEQGRSTAMHEIKKFWTNRIIRIFPVYFIALGAILLGASEWPAMYSVKQHVFWYVAYLQDFEVAFSNKAMNAFDHTWSLAVEQQFYILFGLICPFVARKYFSAVLAIFYVICAVAIIALTLLGTVPSMVYNLPFAGFLFIIIGGAVGVYREEISFRIELPARIATVLTWALALAIVSVGLLPFSKSGQMWSDYLAIPPAYVIVPLSGVAGIFLWLLASYQNLTMVKYLEAKSLLFLGSISYALYVFHFPISFVVLGIVQDLGLRHLGIGFVITFALSAGLALASRDYIERPLAKWKFRDNSFVLRSL